ncbi:MAG: sigma factor-like helix-turn-helix DNA-binding protein [Candidatus Daviesbacteria bacterium]|nr:sigma factor-like helix-turn-helix DNA-binding protein [Candidatus Daviesbacteria bacterium]
MIHNREILFCDMPGIVTIATTDTDPQNFGQSDFSRFNDHGSISDVVQGIVSSLSAVERRVLQLRLGLVGGKPHTQKEIGQAIGYSPRSIRRFEKSAMNKLRYPNP